MKYLIWSIDHTAWRRPASCGYTKRRIEAGRYSKYEAMEICEIANLTAVNTPLEAMVPEFHNEQPAPEVAEYMALADHDSLAPAENLIERIAVAHGRRPAEVREILRKAGCL